VPEAVLERAAAALGFPPGLLRPARRAVGSFRAAVRGWSRADRMLAETVSAELLACAGEALDIIRSAGSSPERLAAGSAAGDREIAAQLWQHLERCNARQRRAIVEELAEYRTWALCELACAQSVEAAPSSPADALELAGLAICIAERCSGEEWLRQRSLGYAWFHVANARRATSDLPASAAALATALRFWEAGASGDPGLFDVAVVLALEATILKSLRLFPDALRSIEQALAADAGALRPRLLLTKAQILGALGDCEGSNVVLREAILAIDEQQEPRTALGLRCRHLVNLCFQGRAAEAALHLRKVQDLAAELDHEVDTVRVVALSGLVAGGCGNASEAEQAFSEARQRFANFEPPLGYDYSVVSLDLALLLLEQGRTVEVKALAEEMAWIFASQGVQREALAALKVFCDAAKSDAATAELARSVIRFLHRSQDDPDLRFEAAQAGE
jgi:tetratricopeptide (TPR) repeat protein